MKFAIMFQLQTPRPLDAGDYLGTVRKCVEVYRRIAELRPEMILKPPNPLMPLPSCPVGTRGTAQCADTLAGAARRRTQL
jgi:hypothetical protein